MSAIDNKLRALKAERAQHSQTIDRLAERLADLSDEIDSLEEAQAQLPDLSVYPVGSILVFDHTFRDSSRRYTYAVIKTSNNAWYTSGPQSPGPYGDERMAEFIATGNPDGFFYEVTTMEQVML